MLPENDEFWVEMFYLNTIKQLFLFIEQLDQLEVCLPYSRLLFQNLRWNSNKTCLGFFTMLTGGGAEKSILTCNRVFFL